MALSLSKVIQIQKLSSRPLFLRVYATRKGKGREKEGTHIRVRRTE